jgi:hypothetical protein
MYIFIFVTGLIEDGNNGNIEKILLDDEEIGDDGIFMFI